MKYRDASGFTTRDPLSFLKTYKTFPKKTITVKQQNLIKYYNFELNWFSENFTNISEAIIKYFPYFLKLRDHSCFVEKVEEYYLDVNYLDKVIITLYKGDHNFSDLLRSFLLSINKRFFIRKQDSITYELHPFYTDTFEHTF